MVSALQIHPLLHERRPHEMHFARRGKSIKQTSWPSIRNYEQNTMAIAYTTRTSINTVSILRAAPSDGTVAENERERAKLGRVPIISRKIHVEIDVPLKLSPTRTTTATDKNDGTKNSNQTESDGIKKGLDVTIWEMEKPSEMIQAWWTFDESEKRGMGDPFGTVMWPGSILASMELMQQHYCHHHSSFSSSSSPSPIKDATVLILGAGTGVEAQTAALLGAKKVIATDINQLTLSLLDYGAKRMVERCKDEFNEGLDGVVEAKCEFLCESIFLL